MTDPISRPLHSSGDLLADRRYAWAEGAFADGDMEAARDLAEQTVEIAAGFAPGWLLLGRARLTGGDVEGARSAFRQAVMVDPTDELGAGLHLARLEAGAAPEAGAGGGAMSEAYVRRLFDDYAGRFETHLTGVLAYTGPQRTIEALDAVAGEHARFAAVDDLGCGTGLMGAAIRARAGHLAGCDLSPAMVRQARQKGVYDELAVAGLTAFLEGRAPAGADLVLAVDVMVYVGDLAPVMQAAAHRLAPGGLFAFTCQKLDGGAPFALGEDMRYAHSAGHIRSVAEAAGFVLVRFTEASMRLDRGAPVPGLVAVLRRS